MECLNQKICRKKPPFVDRTDVSDVDRTGRLHRQSTFDLTHCAAGDAAPGEAQPGSTLFTHWATWVWLCQQDMSAVAPRGHRMCTHLDIQGLSHNPPLCVADYCLVPCTPPLHATHVQARSFVVVEIVCISIYYKNLCERPLLPHYIKHHTCVLLIPNGCAIRKCVSCVLCAHTKQHLQLRSVCCP